MAIHFGELLCESHEYPCRPMLQPVFTYTIVGGRTTFLVKAQILVVAHVLTPEFHVFNFWCYVLIDNIHKLYAAIQNVVFTHQ